MKKNHESKARQILTGILLSGLLGFSTLFAQEWKAITPPGTPAARQGHSMVTLPNGKAFLFGGEDKNGDISDDLYAFNESSWSKVTPKNTPPPPRKNHQAWARADLMYIYGGEGENGPLDDLWSYNPATNKWHQEEISGPRPPARHGQAVTKLTDGSVLIVAGTGADGKPLKDCWRLNTDNTYTRLQDPPYAYTGHSTVLSPDGEWLYVIGKPGSLGIYRVSTDRWTSVAGGPPNGEGCMTSRGKNAAGEPVVYIFGGKNAKGKEMNQTWQYNLYNGKLTQLGNMPQPIVNGSATKIKAVPPGISSAGLLKETGLNFSQDFDQTTLVFGGLSGGAVTNNTYLFSTQTPPDTIRTLATADTIKSDTVKLFWHPASPVQASWYEIQVLLDTTAYTAFADTGLTDTTVTIAGLSPQTNYYWRVRGYNAGGWGKSSIVLHFYTDFVAGIEDIKNPQAIVLRQNLPNPFRGKTQISFTLPRPAEVWLGVYDINGREVERLLKARKPAGTYRLTFDAANLPAGTYFYRLQAGSSVEVKRMIVIR
jgi:hypothetical protein